MNWLNTEQEISFYFSKTQNPTSFTSHAYTVYLYCLGNTVYMHTVNTDNQGDKCTD